MASYENAVIKKMNYNGQKVKKWYHDGVKVFTAGNVVTYYVNTGTSYQEEVDSEASCLSPTTFTPELSGYTFVGWREDTTASGEVLSEKVMGDEAISLYAVFKKTFTLSFANNYASGGATNPVSGNQYYNNGNVVNPVVTLPADGYTRSGLTFVKWVLGTVGTKVTLTADTSTRAVCKYPDTIPNLGCYLGAGYFNNGEEDEWNYANINGTLYSQIYWSSIHCNRADFGIEANGSNLWYCTSHTENGYAKKYINGIDVGDGGLDLNVGATTVNLPYSNVILKALLRSDASAAGVLVSGIRLTGRTVS